MRWLGARGQWSPVLASVTSTQTQTREAGPGGGPSEYLPLIPDRHQTFHSPPPSKHVTCDSRGQCGERQHNTQLATVNILSVLRIISRPSLLSLGSCHQGWHDIITCHIGLFNNTETIKPLINNRLQRIFKWITMPLVARKAEINCSQCTVSCPDHLVVFRLDIQFRCSQPGSVFLTPESDDGIGHGGTKLVSVLRQLTPCRNWNNRKYKLYRKWKHSVMLCFVSYNSHFVEEALLMFPGWWGRLLSNNASPHLRERHQTVQCEGRDTGRDNDALIMYSLELTWDTAWDTLSQQPHHFLVAAADSPRPSIKQTPTRIKQTKLSWNLIYMTVSQNVTTGPLLFWVSAWLCVTATCDEPRCPGTGQTMSHWWYQVLMSTSEPPTPGSCS